ncbi:MAG: hypothetical protein AB7J28_05525 [Hyphomonadaceae bacterium]
MSGERAESLPAQPTRRGLVLRIVAIALAVCAALGSLVVFEAASKTGLANVAANAAARTVNPGQRAQRLAEARALVEASWAAPARWHAGAVEARSWIYALEAQGRRQRGSAFAEASAANAAYGVALAPIQPVAWARLAAFAASGRETLACDLPTCLARSWEAAPMTDAATACARLQLAQRTERIAVTDPRVTWFVRSGFQPRTIARCLDFLPTRDVLHILVAREEEIERRAEEQARRASR